jgi:ATP-dependent Clp protease ATP-binding subunit ClpA
MAHFLFGSEDAFIRLDMSEYKEEHSVSKLIGSPPGYVGFESGGALTNAVRENPFSVILFDEIEKAHTKVLDVFLQILDNGRLTDSKGQPAFFSESIIVLTSNLGTRKTDSRGNPSREADDLSKIRSEIAGFERDQRIREHFVESVEDFFRFEISRPELLNRIGSRIVPFNFIDKDDVQLQIVKDHLKSFWIELGDKYRHRAFEFRSTDQLAEYIVMKYGEQLKDFGGRGISNTLVDVVNVPLAKQVLEAEYQERSGLCFLCDAINGEVRVSTS